MTTEQQPSAAPQPAGACPVLVGVDGSEASARALDWAVMAATATGRPLVAMCSYALPSFTTAALDGGYAALDDSAIAAGAQQVAAEASARAQAAGVPATARISAGDAAGALIAASADASLAVVGTRGGSGFTERLLGTVSSALPAHSQCPVIVVPRSFREGQSLTVPTSVVVGADGSEPSYQAALVAARLAAVWHASITIVTGVPIASSAGLLAWVPSTVDRTQVIEGMRRRIDELAEKVRAEVPGVPIGVEVRDGNEAELLVEASREADLLVVGSRGRGGFAGLLLGSTSQALLHHAACPVLVVNKKANACR